MDKNALRFFEAGIFYVISFFLPMLSWGYFLFFNPQSNDLIHSLPMAVLQSRWAFFIFGSLAFSIILFMQKKVANTYLYYVSKTNLALFSLALYFLPLSMEMPHMVSVLASVPFLFIAVYQLMSIGDKGAYLSNYFLASFLIGGMIVFNSSFMALALLPLIAVFIYNRRTARHILLVLTGLSLPFLYAWVYLYFFRHTSLSVLFSDLFGQSPFIFDIRQQLPFWSIVFFFLLGVFDLFRNLYTMKIRLRKTYFVLLITISLLFITILVLPSTFVDIYFILLPFITIIIGRYFIFLKRHWFNHLLFFIFILVPLLYVFDVPGILLRFWP